MKYNYRINLETGKFEHDDSRSSLAKSIRYKHNQNVLWGNTIHDFEQRVPEYNKYIKAVKAEDSSAIEMIKASTIHYIGLEGIENWLEGVRKGYIKEINNDTIIDRL